MLEICSSRTLFLLLTHRKLLTMKSFLLYLFFGKRAQGVKLDPPTLRTIGLSNQPDENQWYQELRVSSRYGTRGSFYQPR